MQDLANQIADLLRRSEVQYPGLSTADVMQALALAARQARPDAGRGKSAAALLMGVVAAVAGAGIVVWRTSGGSFSLLQIAVVGALLLAAITLVRRLSE